MSEEQKSIEQTFLANVASHQLNVVKDDGIHRHLSFTNNGSSVYRFDIITWPGYLTITGDMGTYVFSRQADMFNFFAEDNKKDAVHMQISPSYWAEKCMAADKDGKGVEKFCSKRFKRNLKDYFDTHTEGDDLTQEEKDAIWAEITGSYAYDSSDEYEAMSFAYDFQHLNSEGETIFTFVDFFEYNSKDYTFHYLWNLYAIVWGISKYEQLKSSEVVKNHIATL